MITEVDKHEVIDQIDCISILKDLNKEVKTAEKISLKVNPPKPERESNRRRKKKSLDEDFIDISDPSSLYLYDREQKSKTQNAKKPLKRSEKVIAVKSKPPQGDLDEILKSENLDKWSYSTPARQTVSPLRLSLSGTTPTPKAPPPEPVQSDYDLTDR